MQRMGKPRDWKWKIALLAFVIISAVVIWCPLPTPPASLPETTPAPPPEAAPDEWSPDDDLLHYRVQDGDTTEAIAKLFVVRLNDLLAINHLNSFDALEPGQTILIPPPY
jgi:hypothetical protein